MSSNAASRGSWATRLVIRLLRRPGVVLLALALLTVAIGHRALWVVQDNSPESFFAVDQQAQATYGQVVEVFGADEVLLVELRGARLDRAADVLAVAQLAQRLGELEGVRNVMSVADSYADPEATTPVAPTSEQLAALRQEVDALELYRKVGLARPEVPALGVVANVVLDGPAARPALIAKVRDELRAYEQAGYEPLVVGLTAAHAAVDREGRATMTLFMPLVVLFIGVIGFAIFRSVRAVVAMLLPVGGAVAIGVAILAWVGQSMNLVSGVMPPLVQAIGFAGATHLVSRYASLSRDGLLPVEAVMQTVRDKLAPTAFAYATTALGFGSLVISDVEPVRVLGAVSAVALVATLVLVTLGTPALLLVLQPRVHMPLRRRLLLERTALRALRARWPVILGGVLVLVPAALGLLQLRSNVDGMSFLSDDVPAKRDFRRLESEGLGLNPLELWIRKPVADSATLLGDAQALAEVAAAVEDEPLVTGTVGAHDVLQSLLYRATGASALGQPQASPVLAEATQRPEAQRQLAPFVDAEQGLRLTLLIATADADQTQALTERIEARARQAFPDAEVVVSGHYLVLIGTPGKLMGTMLHSLLATVAVITLLFFLAFRSLRLVVGGMVANLSPVVLVVGFMGWLDISVDVATVMVGSVAFGVAVDDTFHYLHHRAKSGSIVKAAAIAGQGIVATTFMIAGGFAVLGLSGFGPVRSFGLLTALAVFGALTIDAVLLPALVGDRDKDSASAQVPG